MRRFKSFLFPFLSLCLGIAISAAAAEFALRIWTPKWLTLRMQELNAGTQQAVWGSDRGWPVEYSDGKFLKFTPHEQFRIQFYEYNVIAHIDQYGGRVTTFNPAAPESPIVPFFGDSFTFGMGVADDETYVSLLSRRNKIRFINLGVSGSSLPYQLDILDKRIKEMGSPKVVVFTFFVGNDFSGILFVNQPTLIPSRSPADKWLANVNDFVYHNPYLKNIYLIQLIRKPLLYWKYRSSGQPVLDPFFKIINLKDTFLKQVEPYLDQSLAQLKKLSESHGFVPYFIIIPDTYEATPNLLAKKAKYYGIPLSQIDTTLLHRLLAEKFSKLNISFIDTLPCLKTNPIGTYYIQDNHLTAKGHQVVAECVESSLKAFIEKSLLVPANDVNTHSGS